MRKFLLKVKEKRTLPEKKKPRSVEEQGDLSEKLVPAIGVEPTRP